MTSLRRLLPSGNALFVFEAAAREANFSRAAAELNVTQPAVSRMIGRLERHLDVTLFARGPDGVTLTEEGRILFRAVAGGFSGIAGALEEIRRRRTGLETVTLSLSSAFTTHWLMPRIGALHDACPAVDLRFQLIPGALKGPVVDVDLGMRFLGPGDSEGATFFVDEIVLPVCSPAYAAAHSAPGSVHTCIDLAGAGPDWMGQFRRDGRRPDALEFSDYAVVLQAALLGQGVALGWISAASHWLKEGALVPAGPSTATDRRCCLVVPGGPTPRPAVAAVRDWLVAEMAADLAAVAARWPQLDPRDGMLGGRSDPQMP